MSFVVAATTGPLNILSAYADPDQKIKSWAPEEGGNDVTAICNKDNECEGDANRDARELCEDLNDVDHCKKDN